MSKDVLFKTSAFGGFKKDEVMDYIEKLLSEKTDLEKSVAENNTKISQLTNEIEQYKNEAEDNAQLRSQLADKNAVITELENALNEKDKTLEELNSEITAVKNNSASVELVEQLKGENARLKEENEKKKDLERQVGAAMLDARVHSEELIEAAHEKANEVTKSIYNAIGETALKIDDLSAGIGEIARNFTKSVEEVELRIKVLTGDMSKTAQTLIADSVSVESKKTDDIPVYDFANTDPLQDNE